MSPVARVDMFATGRWLVEMVFWLRSQKIWLQGLSLIDKPARVGGQRPLAGGGREFQVVIEAPHNPSATLESQTTSPEPTARVRARSPSHVLRRPARVRAPSCETQRAVVK